MHCFILILRKEDYAGDIRKFFLKINMIFGAAWLHIDYAAKMLCCKSDILHMEIIEKVML